MDIIFILLYFTFALSFIFMMKLAGLSFFRINPLSFFVLCLMVFSYVGILPLYFYWDSYRVAVGVEDKDIILKVFWYSSISIFLILASFIYSKNFLNLNFPEKLNKKPLNKRQIYFIIGLFILCIYVLILYLSKVPSIALFSSEDAEQVRSSMGNAFQGKYHWYRLFFSEILTYLTILTFANWVITKEWFVLFFSCFAVNVFSTIMATEKAPLVWLFIGLYLTNIMIKEEGQIRVKKGLTLIASSFALLIPMYVFFMHNSFIGAISSVFSRTITGSIMPAYFYLDFVPEHHDFLNGTTLPNPRGIFPFESYRYTVEIMNWVFPDLREHNIVGSMPTVFWGEAYLNWGSSGVIIVSICLGFFLYFLASILSKLFNYGTISVSFWICILLFIRKLSVTGFSMLLFNINLVAMILMFGFLAIISDKEPMNEC